MLCMPKLAWPHSMIGLVVAALSCGLGPTAVAASTEPADAPALPTLATCVEDGHTEERPWGRVFLSRYYPKQTLTPRDRPAELRAGSELQMMEQGFVAIGSIDVTLFTQLHLSSPGQPAAQPIPGPPSALAVAEEEAAKLGADAFTRFGTEQAANEWVAAPPINGWSADVGTRSGTLLRGTLWRLAPTRSGAQLLVAAAERGRAGVVQKLLRARVPLDSREPRFCQTPLIAAAQHGQTEIVRMLLAAGAALELTDTFERTALGYAAFPQLEPLTCEPARLLRQAGAKEPRTPPGHPSLDFPAPPRCPIKGQAGPPGQAVRRPVDEQGVVPSAPRGS